MGQTAAPRVSDAVLRLRARAHDGFLRRARPGVLPVVSQRAINRAGPPVYAAPGLPMTPATFAEHAAILKRSIRDATTRAVDDFKRATGVTPSRIDIQMAEVTSHGDILAQFIVDDVRIGLQDL